MRTLRLAAGAALIAVGLSGCFATDGASSLTTMTWGGERQLRAQTSAVTGIPLERLEIVQNADVGISQNGYIASDSQNADERWACTRNAGILYAGLANAPSCNKL